MNSDFENDSYEVPISSRSIHSNDFENDYYEVPISSRSIHSNDFENDYYEVPSSSRNNIHSSQLSNNDNNIDEEVFSEMFESYFEENRAKYEPLLDVNQDLGLNLDDVKAIAKGDFRADILGNKNNQAKVEEIDLDLGEDNNYPVPNEAENNEEVVEEVVEDEMEMDPYTKEVLDIFEDKITDNLVQIVYGKESKQELNAKEIADIVEIYKEQLAYENQKEQELYENNPNNDLIPEGEVGVEEANVNEEWNDEESIHLQVDESAVRVEEDDIIDDYPEERNSENNEDSIDFDNILVHENLNDIVQGNPNRFVNSINRNLSFSVGNAANYIINRNNNRNNNRNRGDCF